MCTTDGEKLGLHADQGLPSELCLNANVNWALTDYTLEDGPLAVVPRSHLYDVPFYSAIGKEGELEKGVEKAVPVICPKGSMIVFHGKTWHGAFPRQKDGLRLTIANFWRHTSVSAATVGLVSCRDSDGSPVRTDRATGRHPE